MTKDMKIVVDFDNEESETSALMDISIKHDPLLVERINSCYDIRRIQFCQIVREIMQIIQKNGTLQRFAKHIVGT